MSRWQTLSSKEVYRTPWITVRCDEVVTKSGKPLTYSVVSLHHPTVIVVATNDDGQVLLQKNYRYTIDKTLWELPAGHSDGQDPLQAAKRELMEETGLASENWTHLGEYYEAVGIANIPYHVFWAQNVTGTPVNNDHEEDISDHRFIAMDELDSMITRGELQDCQSLAALYTVKAAINKETK